MGMDMRTGELYSPAEFERLRRQIGFTPHHMIELDGEPTREQQQARKVQRNDSCPCGSGYKFKNCCQLGELSKTA